MPEFEFLKKAVRLPERDFSVYRCAAPVVNERALREAAKPFKLAESRTGQVISTEQEMSYTEGPFVVTLQKPSGALRYYDRTRWQIDDGSSQVDMSDDDAVKIARKFITNTALVPLAECKLLKVTRLTVGSMDRMTMQGKERVIDVGVLFQRLIDKTPVEGPGGKVVVYIDHDGAVTGCDRIWRQLGAAEKKFPARELRTPASAQEDLKKYWTPKVATKVEVRDMRFGYFELGSRDLQKSIQPVYFMPITIIHTDGRMMMKSVHVVPAPPRAVALMPAPKRETYVPVRAR